MKMKDPPVTTPDGRYIIVHGRLWRRSNPKLTEAARSDLVAALMDARRAIGSGLRNGDTDAVAHARRQVQAVKEGLGERGPVWWSDGAPDLNRTLVRNTPYAAWFGGLGRNSDPEKAPEN